VARSICEHCQRPLNACICRFIHETDNDILVLILQHPKEVNHTKGSLPLLANSLKNCQVLVGECFDEHDLFHEIINQHSDHCAVLYPSDNAIELSSEQFNEQWLEQHPSHQLKPTEHRAGRVRLNESKPMISAIIVLDATWKKAFKMYQLSSCLKKLPHLKLPQGIKSLYAIRKTQKLDALSTLEACCHALGLLEHNAEKYSPLMDEFIKFNEFQLSFRPSNDNR